MLNRMEKDHIEHQPVRIGTLLVNEGFIRKADVAEAIDIQNRESQLAELALGKLLVKKRLIDKHQLQRLLEHPELRDSVGEFAVERGIIDPRQLAECLRRKPKEQPLAEALVVGGLLTDIDFKTFLERQLNSMKLCELAVRLGMVSESDLAQMVRAKRHQRTIGEILCDLSLITPLDLNSVLTKYRKHLRLGEILLKNGWIDRPTLEMALLEHESRAEPLGNILTEKNILTEDQLFSAFAVQYNIPFRKPEGFKYSDQQKAALTKIMGKAFSRQFRIAPLSLEGNTLTIAIADPENLKVVQSLRSKRVDLRTQCVLVTESTMKLLLDNLYSDGISPPVSRASAPFPEPVDKPPVQMTPPAPPAQAPAEPESLQPPTDKNSLQIIDAVPPEAAEVFKCIRADAGTMRPPQKNEMPEDVEFKTVLSAPQILKADIQRLHSAYEILIEQTGRRNYRSSPGAFETFITTSHQSICSEYNCGRVAYCVQRRAGNVLLFATPEK